MKYKILDIKTCMINKMVFTAMGVDLETCMIFEVMK